MKRGTVGGNEAEDAALAPGATFDLPVEGIKVKNVSVSPGDVMLEITVDESRQKNLDLAPVVQVLSPIFDRWPTQGRIDFEVAVADPDLGNVNGEGIDEVILSIYGTGNDPLPLISTHRLVSQPYLLTLDSVASGLQDGFYVFEVKANASDGGSNTVWFRFTVDNYERTLP
jgi:hypothetical protein